MFTLAGFTSSWSRISYIIRDVGKYSSSLSLSLFLSHQKSKLFKKSHGVNFAMLVQEYGYYFHVIPIKHLVVGQLGPKKFFSNQLHPQKRKEEAVA